MKTRSDQVEPLFSNSRVSQYPGNIDKSPIGEHGQKEKRATSFLLILESRRTVSK
jgi:hypothetical protein